MRIKRDKVDSLFSKLIRERDQYRCQRCFTQHDKSSTGLHCSHFFGRGNNATRFSPNNCIALCFACHSQWEGLKPSVYREFMIDKLGAKKYIELEERARSTVKCGKAEKELIYQYMKEKGLKGLEQFLKKILV